MQLLKESAFYVNVV